MDKISDFFKNIKERISNPLFSSFLIAWIIFNWKIIIGLLFYNNQELKIDGYSSYIDFISKNLTGLNPFWLPLMVAILYTLVFPFIRNCILAFNSWIRAWGSRWILKLSKTGKIPVYKYVELREIYQKRTNLLEEVIEKESTYFKQYEQERNKVLELANERNNLLLDIEKWKRINDVSQLNGEWEIHYLPKEENKIYRIRIHNQNIEYLDPPPPNIIGQTIISFVRIPDSFFLTFTTVFEDQNRSRSFHFFRLDIIDDMKILRGIEDDQFKVEFKKY